MSTTTLVTTWLPSPYFCNFKDIPMNRIFVLIALCSLVSGCSEQVHSTTKEKLVATPVAFNAAGAPTVAFNAPDMMCPEGCGEKVKEILSSQPGAKEVLVDFDAKKATVAIDDTGKFDSKAAVAALVDHGFANSSVNGAPATDSPAPHDVPSTDKPLESSGS
jgi:copper chaperone CopZ